MPPQYRPTGNNVFIVHGHDDAPKLSLTHFLHRLKLNPIILHDEPNRGRTLIEKFEQNASLAGYTFVLLTPDDIGGESGATSLNLRARQNVILELGYFMGALGRKRVCCLYRDGVEIPSDILGVVYMPYLQKIDECFLAILQELRDAGYNINL